ncbi:MAG: adenylate/guanylate cyclase domain-containing protein [Streptosporangiaceae bacterium]|nr:adenylate/guanylate cyclase domain-containing protein [Streptosporangiaceae bacterium]
MAAQTLTFLFTDVEGSTALLTRLGSGYAELLADHHRLIRASLAAHGGEEVDTAGDGFFAVFSSPSACAAAAIEMQRAFGSHPWPTGEGLRVRMGLHSGEASATAAGLIGLGIHRAARIAAAGHGGQIVLSAATAALLGDSMPVGASLRDLGVHRLKDLERPERIFQLQADGLPTAFPPLRSLDNPKLRNNLPAQVSSFIGRDAELSTVQALIASSRLVTLTGSGGAGKTRLGLQVAAGLVDGSGDGVWFADLAPLQDPDLVTVTVANVLGIRSEPGRPLSATVVDAIGQRRMLVLLDNCEHVIDACAKLADALLRDCPNIVLLATSREPLGIGGERVHRVPSMDTPGEHDDLEAIGNSEAVRLFAERAAQHGAPLAWDERTAPVAARICRRLDGMPLAIELAAARLRLMSVTELDARLDQRFSLLTGGSRTALLRQQTLRATVEWSWELLSAAERHMLARLSVFAGGFDLPAAEVVAAGDDLLGAEAITHLGALVDKNLVQFDDLGTGRYRLLETVRQYAALQLEASSPTAAHGARIAHRDHYLALAEAAAPQLIAHQQAEWLDRLEPELDNLRAAIAFSLKQPDPAPGIRLATSLRVFWKARGHAAEGADVLRAFLAAPGVQGATLVRARALAAAAFLLDQTGGYARADAYCQEALAIARSADAFLTADLLYLRAYILLRRGEQDAALPLIEEGLGLARPLAQPHLTACLLAARAFAVDMDGDHAAAARDAAESLRLYRQAGDRLQAGTMAGNLGYAELSLGDLDSARRHLLESLDIARALNDQYGVVYETFNLGLAEYLSAAARPLSASRSARVGQAAARPLSASLSAAEALFAESLDLAARMRMMAGTAYALIGLAMTDDGTRPGRSARLHGAADQALAVLGETLEPLEGRLCDLHRQRLRAAMGAEAFEADYAAGRSLTADEVLALAIGS